MVFEDHALPEEVRADTMGKTKKQEICGCRRGINADSFEACIKTGSSLLIVQSSAVLEGPVSQRGGDRVCGESADRPGRKGFVDFPCSGLCAGGIGHPEVRKARGPG